MYLFNIIYLFMVHICRVVLFGLCRTLKSSHLPIDMVGFAGFYNTF
jgi:hypothetical protein